MQFLCVWQMKHYKKILVIVVVYKKCDMHEPFFVQMHTIETVMRVILGALEIRQNFHAIFIIIC